MKNLYDIINENYNTIEIRDCCNDEAVSIALLNKKHSIEEFQDAIYRAKEKHEEEIYQYGNDWEYISEELDDFDYMIMDYDSADYWVEY